MNLLAEQGDADAQNKLGWMYDNGLHVSKIEVTARKWYRLAAEQGNAFAQTNLGWMYATGRGGVENDVYAYMWGNISASNENEKGGDLRDLIAKRMTPAQIAKAKKLAAECVHKNYKGC